MNYIANINIHTWTCQGQKTSLRPYKHIK